MSIIFSCVCFILVVYANNTISNTVSKVRSLQLKSMYLLIIIIITRVITWTKLNGQLLHLYIPFFITRIFLLQELIYLLQYVMTFTLCTVYFSFT